MACVAVQRADVVAAMSKDNNGGPAFPCEWDYIGTNREPANGMTLRDYFAAKAMQAYLSSYPEGVIRYPATVDDIAADAWDMADAMLKVRNE